MVPDESRDAVDRKSVIDVDDQDRHPSRNPDQALVARKVLGALQSRVSDTVVRHADALLIPLTLPLGIISTNAETLEVRMAKSCGAQYAIQTLT